MTRTEIPELSWTVELGQRMFARLPWLLGLYAAALVYFAWIR